MISEKEVGSVIGSEIPSLAIDLSMMKNGNDVFKTIGCLTDHTKELIREHRSSEVIDCFRTAYELLHEGRQMVRFAIVGIYIQSVSRLLECSFCPEPSVRSEFLRNFGDEYYKLIYAKNP